MHRALPDWMKGRPTSWFVIGGFWISAVVLSTLQIYFRETARGLDVPWSEVLVANALAWLPWLAIAPAVISLERRFPLPGPSVRLRLATHIASALLISLGFLVYLGYFHAAYLEGGGLVPSWTSFSDELTEKIGQHFLVAVALYLLIALGSYAHRTWSDSRTDDAGCPSEPVDDSPPSRSLIVRSVGEVQRVEASDVDWIEGCGNYARLHLGGRAVLIRRTLGSLGKELEGAGFIRVHRSAIVNSKRVTKLRKGSHGDAEVELEGGPRVKVSRTYRRTLQKQML